MPTGSRTSFRTIALALATASWGAPGCLCASEDGSEDAPPVGVPRASAESLLGTWRGRGLDADAAPQVVTALVRGMQLTFSEREMVLRLGQGDRAHEQRHPYEVVETKGRTLVIETLHDSSRRRQIVEIVDTDTILFQKDGSNVRAILERVR